MNLNIFNFWKSITTPDGRKLEYRTHKKDKLYTTTVRDVDSEAVILKSVGINKENAETRALSRLSRAKENEIAYAINSGKPLEYNTPIVPKVDVWDDSQRILSGQHRRPVIERKPVQEAISEKNKTRLRTKVNNLVAKHAHINKGGAMKDKTDFTRKVKHKKKLTDE